MSSHFHRRFFAVALLTTIGSVFLTNLPAQDDETRKAPLEKWGDAIDQYESTLETLKASLMKVLDSVEERARKEGDLDRVRRVKSERLAFETESKMPMIVSSSRYQEDVSDAQKKLKLSAKGVQADLLKLKLDKEAELVASELENILKPVKKAAENEKSPRWVGNAGNIWQHMDGKSWIELQPNGSKDNWEEVVRNSRFVELKDSKRKIGVRLFERYAEVHYGDGRWGRWGTGKWAIPLK
ncbi:MAG TPA: hypothetical protein VM165_08310 [Planctomycetaceae bacterium]|nr:hypothetical protein [Planctomycetaceae bacterium]